MKDPYFGFYRWRTPAEDPLPTLLERLDACQKQILVIAYGFTLPDVIDRMNAKHDAGLDVRAILDSSQAAGTAEKAQIARIRFPFVTGRSDKGGIIHLKVGIFDGYWNWSGSYNWSESAGKQDNDAWLIRSVSLATERIAEFETEWTRLGGAPATAAKAPTA